MNIHQNIEELKHWCKKSVITVGNFDGVHLGHRSLIREVKKHAYDIDGTAVIFTFYPHPRIVLNAFQNFKLLNTKEEKIELIKQENPGHLVIFPFDEKFANSSFVEFVENILVKSLNVRCLIIGYDHKFGKNREGNIENLYKLSRRYDFRIIQIKALKHHGQIISSKLIRSCISEGKISEAAEYLGYNYYLTGKVIQGNKIGNTIEFPTANVKPDNSKKLVPAIGVYATFIEVNGKSHKSMTNIGYRPTLNMKDVAIETHIFDFDETIYDQEIRLHFVKKIREEKKFDDIEALKNQLHHDKANVQKIL